MGSWVLKYRTEGIEGLYDRRGHKKAEEELTELEKLQAENRMLKAKAKRQQMEIDLLKKLKEIEVTLGAARNLTVYTAIQEFLQERPDYPIRILCE